MASHDIDNNPIHAGSNVANNDKQDRWKIMARTFSILRQIQMSMNGAIKDCEFSIL